MIFAALPEQPFRRAMSVEPTMRRSVITKHCSAIRDLFPFIKYRKKIFEEVEGYKEAPDKKPMFNFPLRDRFIQEGVGFKLICSVDGKPMPEVKMNSIRNSLPQVSAQTGDVV
jgi:hypothetical protein